MSRNSVRKHASLFAALGDETRLALLVALCASAPLSITRLTEGSGLTRQAVTKHLLLLQEVGLVRSERVGRETHFHASTDSLDEAVRALQSLSRQWDVALARLKTLAEQSP